MDRIRPLRNPIRHYDWGSRSALARLQGRPTPSERPEAELWLGAHPSAPSQVDLDGQQVPLDAWIARDSARALGERGTALHGGVLPFLLKVLAPQRALSIQTHPNAAQARRGFEREEHAGLAADDPRRCYRDARAKPELICALTRFEALCGLRPAAQVDELLAAVDTRAARALRSAARAGGSAAALRALLDIDATGLAQTLAALARAGTPLGEPIARLAEQYPGDPGALAPLLMQRVELAPGEALFLEAGEIHAYLGGLGVEVMGNSDNVLRCALTAKHVDATELFATLHGREGTPRVLRPREGVYETPAREFELAVLRVEGDAPLRRRGGRAQIWLCTQGRARLSTGDPATDVDLARGQAAFVAAAIPHVDAHDVSGDATTLFVAEAGA